MDKTYLIHSFDLAIPEILSICTVNHTEGNLLALTTSHECFLIDTFSRSAKRLFHVALPEIDRSNDNDYFGPSAYTIHASEFGDYIAIIIDRGCFGVVIHSATGQITMRLNGGDYYQETVPFSLSFMRHANRDLLIHRTDWNRLDISDPSDGKCLTERHIAEYTQNQRPEHYLDYFHGKISVSPNHKRIFDDGWVWHPLSVPRAWSLEKWIEKNPWESEDGDSIVAFGFSDDWTIPHCWIDDDTLCFEGGSALDIEAGDVMHDQSGVEIHVFDTIKETHRFSISAHPLGSIQALISDGNALAVTLADQTEIWDITTQKLKHHIEGFCAKQYSKKYNVLISLEGNCLSYLEFPA